jgi:hypothetical protein
LDWSLDKWSTSVVSPQADSTAGTANALGILALAEQILFFHDDQQPIPSSDVVRRRIHVALDAVFKQHTAPSPASQVYGTMVRWKSLMQRHIQVRFPHFSGVVVRLSG